MDCCPPLNLHPTSIDLIRSYTDYNTIVHFSDRITERPGARNAETENHRQLYSSAFVAVRTKTNKKGFD